MKKIDTLKISRVGLLLAAALIISLIENTLPPLVPLLPYAKLGLSNIIFLACFLIIGFKEGFLILFARSLMMAVFSGNFVALIWSLPAGLIAYIVMCVMVKINFFSVVAISSMGGMLHNFVQIVIGAIVTGKGVFIYLPYMLLIGGIAGIFTGFCCLFVVKALSIYQNGHNRVSCGNKNIDFL